MSTEYEIVNPLEFADWDDHIAIFPERSSFHSLRWARVLRESYGYRPCYIAFRDQGTFKGIVPMMEIRSFLTGVRGVSLPFSDDCSPLLDASVDKRVVTDATFAYGRAAGWKEVEFRGGDLLAETLSPSAWYYRHKLFLTETNAGHLAALRHSTRNNIRKAQKSGVVVVKGRAAEDMEKFYKLNVLTRKKHGLPPQPLSFFRKLHEHVIAQGQGSIVSAHFNGECISGVICLEFANKVMVKYAATAHDAQDVRPNNLLIWEMIRSYHEEGFSMLDFGRTDPQNAGLRKFKIGWNVEETLFSYFKYDLDKNRSASPHLYSTDFLSTVFRAMPGPVLRLVGKVLYKHIG